MIKHKITEKSGILSLDISKGNSHVYLSDSKGKGLLKVKQYKHERSSLDELSKRVNACQQEQALTQIHVAYESTGPYSEAVINYLIEQGYQAQQINPLHVKRLKELEGNNRVKSDKKDPHLIGLIARMGKGISRRNRSDENREELRLLSHYREQIKDKEKRCINHLESYVHLLFPEYGQTFKSLKSKTSLFMLKEYGAHPKRIGNCRLSSLTKKLRKISRGRKKEDDVKALIYNAKQTLGNPLGASVIAAQIKELSLELLSLIKRRENIEKQQEIALAKIEEKDLLDSFPGIGTTTKAIICSEIGDWRDYPSSRAVEKAIGFNLYESSSGKRFGRKRIAKAGNPLIRKTIYFLCLKMIKKNGLFRPLYEHHLSKGMKRKQAIVAIARKVIRILFSMFNKELKFNKEQVLNTFNFDKK